MTLGNAAGSFGTFEVGGGGEGGRIYREWTAMTTESSVLTPLARPFRWRISRDQRLLSQACRGRRYQVPVSTAAECGKFSKMFLAFADTNRSHSLLDSHAFALEWNKDVSAMEEGQSPVVPTFRKTAASLKAYWTK